MKGLWQQLANWAQTRPSATALVSPAGQLDFAGLWQAIEAGAERCRALAVAGRPLALAGDNSVGWVLADLACARAQVPCVPIPPFFSPLQREHLLRDSGASGLLVAETLTWQHQPLPSTPMPSLPAGSLKVTYTSGTTGTPKGICLGAEQQLATTQALAQRLGQVSGRRHLCTMPLAVLLENLAGVYLPLYLGRQVQLQSLASLGLGDLARPDPHAFVTALAQSGADSLILLPATLSWLVAGVEQQPELAKPWSMLAVGGGKSSVPLLQRARALGLPVCEGYGLSEVASVVALDDPAAPVAGTVGQPLPHLAVKIAEDGEIWLGGNGHLGILGVPDSAAPHWQATGDLGQWDDTGRLLVLGRKKSTLVTSLGRNVSPEWLEAELCAIPGVLQAWVYGDEVMGIQALLFAPHWAANPAGLAVQIQHCMARLPAYARLQGWQRTDTPFSAAQGELTSNGRLRRDTLYLTRLNHNRQGAAAVACQGDKETA
ncbi:AMP-binding protein [Pseudaeromonas paramecii]|uniref:AMP-dependent synthetase/ligase n=1 Tax=Pseudaeromonas paramecii TaxID=2138166 RepID=A0ABP8PU22_9GAMM